ncbi:MAG: polysaccharide biosynthesis/export family protein, partial [Silvibacterium sp.]
MSPKPLRLCSETIFGLISILLFGLQATAQATVNDQPSSTFPPSTSSTTPLNPATTPSTGMALPAADQAHYMISPGDVLDVSVFGAPDLSQRAVVNSGGNIYMPLIKYVHIAGMHVEDAQSVVENAYLVNAVLKFPHVSIVITSYSSGVVLMGEVAKTGIYPIVGAGKLFDSLAEAGGTTASAGQVVTITHKNST